MDTILSLVPIVVTLGVGLMAGSYVQLRQFFSSDLAPKYHIGDCVVFEQDSHKYSGVIVSIQYGWQVKPIRASYYDDHAVREQTDRLIVYKVDIKHCKFDFSMHPGKVEPWRLEHKKPSYVWVYESDIAVVTERN